MGEQVLCNLVLGTCVNRAVLQYFPLALQALSKPQILFPLFSFFSLFVCVCVHADTVFKWTMDSTKQLWKADTKSIYVCMSICLSQMKATFNDSDSAIKSRACLRVRDLFDLQRKQG